MRARRRVIRRYYACHAPLILLRRRCAFDVASMLRLRRAATMLFFAPCFEVCMRESAPLDADTPYDDADYFDARRLP